MSRSRAGGGGLTVDERPAAAIGLDDAADQQRFARFDLTTAILDHRGKRAGRRIEGRGDDRLRRAMANERGFPRGPRVPAPTHRAGSICPRPVSPVSTSSPAPNSRSSASIRTTSQDGKRGQHLSAAIAQRTAMLTLFLFLCASTLQRRRYCGVGAPLGVTVVVPAGADRLRLAVAPRCRAACRGSSRAGRAGSASCRAARRAAPAADVPASACTPDHTSRCRDSSRRAPRPTFRPPSAGRVRDRSRSAASAPRACASSSGNRRSPCGSADWRRATGPGVRRNARLQSPCPQGDR